MPATESQRAGRFDDWRLALKSILGFWLVYAATVVVRAFLGSDPWSVLYNRVPIIFAGFLLTGAIYLVLGLIARRSSLRRRAIAAAILSLLGGIAQASVVMSFERHQRPSREEFRHVAREGVVIVEKGREIRIERAAQDPLVLTLPALADLERSKRIRIIADAAVTWFFFFAAWSAFYLATLAQAQALGARRRAAEAEAAAQSAQIRALRYQVNPHFLFNTLNSLSSLIMTKRNDRAEEMLLALSTFFRTSLSLDPTAEVTLAEEIDLQRLYLDIEKVRFPTRLKVEIDVPDTLQKARLPALILQPLVENAIKYGVSRSKGQVMVRIEARRTPDGQLALTVSDSGGTPVGKQPDHGTGVGLRNVVQRLEARYGAAATSRFGTRPEGGYEAVLTLPLEVEHAGNDAQGPDRR
ncbi:sensor histidine kinase [Sphingomonas mesophila]|uniref:sensor histidine kinase n=1 Tax=Sphingomonas mesophila TaxID=2303576 RepID=UPI000E57D643|nr:histidine kinase [Sphingomonas mesophila]